MTKEKILFVNYDMSIGGNVTSMLAWLGCIDLDRYDVDLLLYRNTGDFLPLIPDGVRLLPQAFNCESKIKKYGKALFGGYLFRAFLEGRRQGTGGLSYQVMATCQARAFSRALDDEYDYAVGFFEGWSDRYIAERVRAKHKYGWLHSMFREICPNPTLELGWMQKVEKIVCVSAEAHAHFCDAVPQMKDKAVYYQNILSTDFVRRRAEDIDEDDEAYKTFVGADCFKIVTVCRIDTSSKALERAVSAAKRLKEHGCRFLWYIIGDGKDRALIERLIDENGVGDVCLLIGKRTNPYPFVKAADIFCLTSRYEGKPMVITETMMLCTPPVVTEYASARDQITHGVDGRIAENNDDAIMGEILFCYDKRDDLAAMHRHLAEHEYGNEDYALFLQNELFSEH